MVPDGRLHLIGYVVDSIEECASGFAQSLNTTWTGEIYRDLNQMAAVTFLYPGTSEEPAIELVAPLGDRAPVTGFLGRGGGLHHVCYEVNDLEAALRDCVKADVKLVRAAAPAVAFDHRPIAWIYTRYGLLVELLERPTAGGSKAFRIREELP